MKYKYKCLNSFDELTEHAFVAGIKFSPYKCRKCDASFEDTMKRYKHEAVEHDGLHPSKTFHLSSFNCPCSENCSKLEYERTVHTVSAIKTAIYL